jgi:hypothetical protein
LYLLTPKVLVTSLVPLSFLLYICSTSKVQANDYFLPSTTSSSPNHCSLSPVLLQCHQRLPFALLTSPHMSTLHSAVRDCNIPQLCSTLYPAHHSISLTMKSSVLTVAYPGPLQTCPHYFSAFAPHHSSVSLHYSHTGLLTTQAFFHLRASSCSFIS